MSLIEQLQRTLANSPGARATNFDDESIKSSQVEGYKAKAGSTDRIAVVDPAVVVVGRAHYGGPGVGYVLCKSEYTVDAGVEVLSRKGACCLHMPDEAKIRIVVPIIKYATKPNGELLKPFTMEYLVWRINEAKFAQLRGIHKEWGLDKHDLIITCDDEKYQTLTISVARDRVANHPEVQKQFGSEVAAFMAQMVPKLSKQIGNDVSETELLNKLGKTAPAATVRVSDAPVGNIDDLLR